MKVAMVTRLFPKDSLGGGQFHAYEMWKRLKRDFEVHLISGWENDPKLLPEGTYLVDQRRRNRILNYFKMHFGVKKHLKKIKPDVVIASCLEVPLIYKTVFFSHHLGHLIDHNSNLFSRVQGFLARRKLKKMDRILAVSKSTKEDLIRMGVDNDKIKLVYNGIDLKRFKPKEVKNKIFTVTYPSRISREKGQDVLINAVKDLKGVRTIIVGYVSDHDYLRKLEAMKGNVEIVTNVPDIVKYYQIADVVVFPTLMTEGFGFTAAEAMACGKPVIASDYPAVREVVGEGGIIVKPGSSVELRKAIVKLKNDKRLRESLGKNGLESVRERFDWDKSYLLLKKELENLK